MMNCAMKLLHASEQLEWNFVSYFRFLRSTTHQRASEIQNQPQYVVCRALPQFYHVRNREICDQYGVVPIVDKGKRKTRRENKHVRILFKNLHFTFISLFVRLTYFSYFSSGIFRYLQRRRSITCDLNSIDSVRTTIITKILDIIQ